MFATVRGVDSGSAAYNDGATLLALGSWWGFAEIWDPGNPRALGSRYEWLEQVGHGKLGEVQRGQNLVRLAAHTTSPGSLALNHDGTLLAISTWHRTGIWDTATGHRVAYLSGATRVQVMAFNPSGTRLATGSTAVRIWDTGTWQCLDTLNELQGWFDTLATPHGIRPRTSGFTSTARRGGRGPDYRQDDLAGVSE